MVQVDDNYKNEWLGDYLEGEETWFPWWDWVDVCVLWEEMLFELFD